MPEKDVAIAKIREVTDFLDDLSADLSGDARRQVEEKKEDLHRFLSPFYPSKVHGPTKDPVFLDHRRLNERDWGIKSS